MNKKTEKQYWLDKPGNVDKFVYALYGLCAVLFAADFFYTKHVEFSFEHWFGFYAIFGFVACVALVVASKWLLRPTVMRDEDYYADDQPLDPGKYKPGDTDD